MVFKCKYGIFLSDIYWNSREYIESEKHKNQKNLRVFYLFSWFQLPVEEGCTNEGTFY